MEGLGKVVTLKAHQSAAVKARIAADPIMRVGGEKPAVLIAPLFLGAIFAVNEYRLWVPIVVFDGQMGAPL
jgi:hypothetical protein